MCLVWLETKSSYRKLVALFFVLIGEVDKP
jgi:hypothetical protein